MPVLQCGRYNLDLSRPYVMGIVNVTPDSFSDGGRHLGAQAAIAHAHRLLSEGAHMLDIGGESTRPGAAPVSEQHELDRILPVLEALRDVGVPVSVDTAKPGVMRAALAAGADMINDIFGFRMPGAIDAVAASGCGLCTMHMQGEPRTMQAAPQYHDVVADIRGFLLASVRQLEAGGIDHARICVDPGFGFGKTPEQNYLLLRELARLGDMGYPLLVGLSRKAMIGAATGKPVDQRVSGSIAGALACIARGASIVRVHDVAETVDAVNVWRAIQAAQGSSPGSQH